MAVGIGESLAPRDTVPSIVRFNSRLAWIAVVLTWVAVAARLRWPGDAPDLAPQVSVPLALALLVGYCWLRSAGEVAEAMTPGYRQPGPAASFVGWVLPLTSWAYGPWAVRGLLRASGVRGVRAGAAYVLWALSWALQVSWSTMAHRPTGPPVRADLVVCALAWTALVLIVRRAQATARD